MRKPYKHFNYIMAFHYKMHLKPPHFDKRCPHILQIESISYFHMLNSLLDFIECVLIREFHVPYNNIKYGESMSG